MITASVSLKIKHLEVHCDTKSKDNVFVQVVVAGKLLSHIIHKVITIFINSYHLVVKPFEMTCNDINVYIYM